MDVKVDELCSIAIRAGKKIMEIYDDPNQNWGIESKNDDSPLTVADTQANKIICDALRELYPEVPIISEENKQLPYEERKDWEWFWLVDPLDGTKEFIKRNGEFTVNIALVHGQSVHSGVVYLPANKKLFYAVQGSGAFLKENGDVQPMSISELDVTKTGVRIVCSRSHMNDDTREFVSQFDSPELVSAGSSLKFMLIAEGKADVYPRMGPTMEWDTAAAHAIVKEAGGKVIDQKTDQELVYNKESLLNNYFLVK